MLPSPGDAALDNGGDCCYVFAGRLREGAAYRRSYRTLLHPHSKSWRGRVEYHRMLMPTGGERCIMACHSRSVGQRATSLQLLVTRCSSWWSRVAVCCVELRSLERRASGRAVGREWVGEECH